MKSIARIKFNPVTKAIEVEGTEQFVKTYFDELQAMTSGSTEKKVAIKKTPKPAKAAPVKATKKISKTIRVRSKKKNMKVAKEKPGGKRLTNMASVIGLIQGSTEGISTAELKKKTGLAERQIWNIVNSAAKEGKIRKMKRGLYCPRE